MPNDHLTIDAARPGMRDRHGYLRWTPTSCRRCGYEKADCTCLGGFAAPASEPTLAALLSERDAATARAAAAELRAAECVVATNKRDRERMQAEREARNAEAQRDAAIAERDALRDEWEEIAAGITTERPEIGALWPMVSEVSGNLAAVRNLFRNEVGAHNRTKAERDRMARLVARASHCMPLFYDTWHAAARAALTSAKEPGE